MKTVTAAACSIRPINAGHSRLWKWSDSTLISGAPTASPSQAAAVRVAAAVGEAPWACCTRGPHSTPTASIVPNDAPANSADHTTRELAMQERTNSDQADRDRQQRASAVPVEQRTGKELDDGENPGVDGRRHGDLGNRQMGVPLDVGGHNPVTGLNREQSHHKDSCQHPNGPGFKAPDPGMGSLDAHLQPPCLVVAPSAAAPGQRLGSSPD